ncbi:MAG: aldo/keto reductase, partial [Candidatus Brocadiia bacterium]
QQGGKAEKQSVPMRKLGKTGAEIACLGLGTNRFYENNQILLRKAYEYGITYWDTCPVYGGDTAERGIGEFISKKPAARSKLFIATKATSARQVSDYENLLRQSLSRMNTQYIDLYLGHEFYHPAQFKEDLRKWVLNARERKLIRFFGISTHKNMTNCLNAVSRLDWVDVVMASFNFRLMQDNGLQKAVDACFQAGKGIIAMKTQGHGVQEAEKTLKGRQSISTAEDKRLIEHLLNEGYTEGQAKLKLVLDDQRISSACVGVTNVSIMSSNVSAVLDKKKLSQRNKDAFAEYAQAGCSGYCAGCAEICDSVLGMPYVSDVMRYLMYYKSYGDKKMAMELYSRIPRPIRESFCGIDYSKAEEACPQGLPIAKLMAEAVQKLNFVTA